MRTNRTLLGARISNDLKNNLLHHCEENGLKIGFFVEQAIQEKLRKVAALTSNATFAQPVGN